MSTDAKREERTDIQGEMLDGDLYEQVKRTAAALRSSHDYDTLPWRDHGEVAVLCYALQRSADQSAGTSVNYAGVCRTLTELHARAKAAR